MFSASERWNSTGSCATIAICARNADQVAETVAALLGKGVKAWGEVVDIADGPALQAFVRKAAIGVWHASCTCRMGRADDPMAVVDTQGRVKGVQGLRVVDASIFPIVPCANTNFPTLMTAEKISDAILQPS